MVPAMYYQNFQSSNKKIVSIRTISIIYAVRIFFSVLFVHLRLKDEVRVDDFMDGFADAEVIRIEVDEISKGFIC